METIRFQFGKDAIEFGTMDVPNRKNKALISMRGSQAEVLAYFRNDDCAKEFEQKLSFIVEKYDEFHKIT